MEFIRRFVLMPGARVRSTWLPWTPAADGDLTVCVEGDTSPGGLEVRLERRVADDLATNHATLALSAADGVNVRALDPIDATSVRMQVFSKSDRPVPLALRLVETPMT